MKKKKKASIFKERLVVKNKWIFNVITSYSIENTDPTPHLITSQDIELWNPMIIKKVKTKKEKKVKNEKIKNIETKNKIESRDKIESEDKIEEEIPEIEKVDE